MVAEFVTRRGFLEDFEKNGGFAKLFEDFLEAFGNPAFSIIPNPTLKAEEKPVFPETGSKALIGTAEGESGSGSASSAKNMGSGVSGECVEDSGSK